MTADEIREHVLRFIVKQDINRHRDIYDKLTDE